MRRLRPWILRLWRGPPRSIRRLPLDKREKSSVSGFAGTDTGLALAL